MKHQWKIFFVYEAGKGGQSDCKCKTCGVVWDGENKNYECEPDDVALNSFVGPADGE